VSYIGVVVWQIHCKWEEGREGQSKVYVLLFLTKNRHTENDWDILSNREDGVSGGLRNVR
jgi:hypothetical protein